MTGVKRRHSKRALKRSMSNAALASWKVKLRADLGTQKKFSPAGKRQPPTLPKLMWLIE